LDTRERGWRLGCNCVFYNVAPYNLEQLAKYVTLSDSTVAVPLARTGSRYLFVKPLMMMIGPV
jgi:hypothetical protein